MMSLHHPVALENYFPFQPDSNLLPHPRIEPSSFCMLVGLHRACIITDYLCHVLWMALTILFQWGTVVWWLVACRFLHRKLFLCCGTKCRAMCYVIVHSHSTCAHYQHLPPGRRRTRKGRPWCLYCEEISQMLTTAAETLKIQDLKPLIRSSQRTMLACTCTQRYRSVRVDYSM